MTDPRRPRARGTGGIRRLTTATGQMRYYPILHGKWYPAEASEEAADRVLRRLIHGDATPTPPEAAAPTPHQAVANSVSAAKTILVAGMRVRVVTFETLARTNYLPSLDPERYGRPDGILPRPGKDTWKDDRIAITENILIPCLGPMLTYQMQMLDVLELMQGRIEGYAPTRDGSRCHDHVSLQTAKNEANVLSQICQDAMFASCMFHNPCPAARSYARRLWHHDPRQRPALNPTELAGLVARTDEAHIPLMALLGDRGPRLGEAIAIPIRNYHPDSGLITFDQSRTRARICPPKTKSGRRTIQASEALNRKLRRALDRARRIPNKHDLLFPGPAGGYIDPSHWRESVFQPAVKRAIADRVFSQEVGSLLVPHALRHTAAHNMLLHYRVDLTQVMAILGHATPATTSPSRCTATSSRSRTDDKPPFAAAGRVRRSGRPQGRAPTSRANAVEGARSARL